MPRAQGLLGIKPGIIFNSTHQHQQHRGHQQHKNTTFADIFSVKLSFSIRPS